MAAPVELVGVQFLNARPLLAGLEAGLVAPFPYRFSTAEPAVCADRLAAGQVTAGLVPVAALAGSADVRALPGLGVAARREVTSVLLVSRVPAPRIRTLAAHTASRTSVALARLLLRERWDAEPDVVPARPPLASMMALADAAVIIGDPALAVHGRTGMLEVDLARAWVEWTGLPFVFAVWGVAAGAPTGLDALLVSSLAYAERRWESMIPVWAAEHGVGEAETRRYLGEAITYRLTGEERRGMEEFLERGALAGLLPARTGVWRAG